MHTYMPSYKTSSSIRQSIIHKLSNISQSNFRLLCASDGEKGETVWSARIEF